MADFDQTDMLTRSDAMLNGIFERQEESITACGCTAEHTEADVQSKYEEATSGQPCIEAEIEVAFREAKLNWVMLEAMGFPHMVRASKRYWYHSLDELTLLFDDVDVPYQCPSSKLFAQRMENR